jgi:hypothetical protein
MSSLYFWASIYRCLFGFSLLISEIVGLVGGFVNGGGETGCGGGGRKGGHFLGIFCLG